MRHWLLPLLFVALAAAIAHTNLQQALRHHSSVESAPHRRDLHKIDLWAVQPLEGDDKAIAFAESINRQLAVVADATRQTQRVRLHKITKTGIWVFEAGPELSADALTAILMSEQRAGGIQWFHRDGVASRKSH